MNKIRFERLSEHDFAVYVAGFADAIGKAGKIGDDCWFKARSDLGGAIAWEKTMLDAVKEWAVRASRRKLLHRLILREMFIAMITGPITEVVSYED